MTKRDRTVLGVLALVAVIAGFYMLMVKPTSEDVAALDDQIAAADTRRDVALAELQNASVAREQYERDQSTLAVLGKAVPADDGVPSLIYQLHKAARKAGVEFDSVDVAEAAAAATPATGAQGLTPMPMKVKFDGTFFKLDRFLRAVHAFAKIGEEKVDVRGRLLTIDAIDLAPEDGSSSTLSAEITVTAYTAPKDGAAATTATGTASGSAGGTTSGTATPSTSSTTTSGASSTAETPTANGVAE